MPETARPPLTDDELARLADMILDRDPPERWVAALSKAFWQRAAYDLKIGIGGGVLTVLWRSLIRWLIPFVLLLAMHSYGFVHFGLDPQQTRR